MRACRVDENMVKYIDKWKDIRVAELDCIE